MPVAQLDKRTLFWQAAIASPTGAPNEQFSVLIRVIQDGKVVGTDPKTGPMTAPLPFGFIRFIVEEIMKTLRSQFLLSLLNVTCSAPFAWGQTSPPKSISNASSPLATLTLTFREPTADYAVFSSDDAQNRYYIQVPASNVPSYKLSDGSGAKLMVDNEKSSAER